MSAKPDQWMPLYFGAYLTDTMHLTTEQHGAYFLLLMACWKRGGSLPDDDGQLAATCRLTPAQWKKARAVIAPFWTIARGTWTQKRLTAELEKARNYVAAQSENGKLGGRPRKAEENPPLSGGESQREPEHKAESKPDETPVPLPTTPFTAVPTPSPSTSTAPTRPGAIAALLRRTAAEQGKNLRLSSMEQRVIDWADKGISDTVLLEAFALAIADREASGEKTAINSGFLDVFITKLLKAQRTPSAAPTGKPWFLSWEKIVEKGAEKGFAESDFDSPPAFRAAVFAECGITDEDVRKAEADWRVAA